MGLGATAIASAAYYAACNTRRKDPKAEGSVQKIRQFLRFP